ncbi:MAG: pyridoxal-phosphate dependent enzyme, partial [Calditrichia bacterium]
LELEIGFRQLFLKFEGANPTGTQKDRVAFAQAMDALRRGFEAITLSTCGNYGVAMALAASVAGIRCIIYIPESYQTRRVKEMTDFGAEIIRIGGDYETSVQISRQRAETDEIYDANPGGANTALQLSAYGEIAYEKMPAISRQVSSETGLPACDPLLQGVAPVITALKKFLK